MLESLLSMIMAAEETLTPATRAAAVQNWMKLFAGRETLLQRMVDDYSGLIRRHSLQVTSKGVCVSWRLY